MPRADIKDKFEDKLKKYENALKVIKYMEQTKRVKENSSIQDLFNVIRSNNHTIYSQFSKGNMNGGRLMQQNWDELSSHMQNIYIKEGMDKEIGEFFENIPDKVVKEKAYKDFYDICMDSIASTKRKELNNYEEKEKALAERVQKAQMQAKRAGIEPNIDVINHRTDIELEEYRILKKKYNIKDVVSDFQNMPPELKEKRNRITQLIEIRRGLEKVKNELPDLKKQMFNASMESLIDDAKMYHAQINCKKGLHRNSKEFDNMANALEMVANWNDPVKREQLAKNLTEEQVFENLKVQTNNYLNAKKEQRRPIPSARRNSRMILANKLLELANEGIAKSHKLAYDKVAEQKEPTKQVTVKNNEPATVSIQL